MTCKDCLYETVCKEWSWQENQKACSYGDFFKNKADFVEVVRCINCKHRMFSDMYIECSKRLEIVRADHFCSYGERRVEE